MSARRVRYEGDLVVDEERGTFGFAPVSRIGWIVTAEQVNLYHPITQAKIREAMCAYRNLLKNNRQRRRASLTRRGAE